MILQVVLRELCGRETLLYPSEQKLLQEAPRLTIACDHSLEAWKSDPAYPLRIRVRLEHDHDRNPDGPDPHKLR
jgi:hypothetical protein